MVDRAAVLAANIAFYQAFEEGSFDVMSDLWEHSDRASCTHPGWPTLRGWSRISASWVALLRSGAGNQFIITNEHVEVVGDTAWVTCDENLLGPSTGGTVASVNMFVLSDGQWRVVVHHGSGIAS